MINDYPILSFMSQSDRFSASVPVVLSKSSRNCEYESKQPYVWILLITISLVWRRLRAVCRVCVQF